MRSIARIVLISLLTGIMAGAAAIATHSANAGSQPQLLSGPTHPTEPGGHGVRGAVPDSQA